MDYKRIYFQIIENRKKNKYNGYTEKHHIIPKSLGGSDDKGNLVKLSAKEHFICHLLLTKFYKKGSNEYYKMVHAFTMMLNCSSPSHENMRYVSSRRYEKLKSEYSEAMRINQAGERNSNFGKMWIHNPELKESKKISKTEAIPDGWSEGRVIDWNLFGKNKKRHYRRCVDCKEKFTTENVNSFYCMECKTNIIAEKYCICGEIIEDTSKTYCSSRCKRNDVSDYTFDLYRKDFLEQYAKEKSLNKALKNVGLIGAFGIYYDLAVRSILNCDNLEIKEIYEKNRKKK